MYLLKLEVEDSVIDKVKMFLKQLPQNSVRIEEGSSEQLNNIDFIEYLVSHPVNISKQENFLSRNESNAR